ncbi:MAG: hypothetical protein MJZ81_07260 [Bacteroidales bacterium]|nr:hypothetical protein [Bacteroidales bacterium]
MTGLGWAFGRSDVDLLGITPKDQAADIDRGIPMYWQYGWSKYYDSNGSDYKELPSIEDWDRYIAFVSRKQFFMKCGGLNTADRISPAGTEYSDEKTGFVYNGYADGCVHSRKNLDGSVDFVMSVRRQKGESEYDEGVVVVVDSSNNSVVADPPASNGGDNGPRRFGAQFFMTPKQGICGLLTENILGTSNAQGTAQRPQVDYISIDDAISRAFNDHENHRLDGTLTDSDVAYYFAGQAPDQTLEPVDMSKNEWMHYTDDEGRNRILSTMKIPYSNELASPGIVAQTVSEIKPAYWHDGSKPDFQKDVSELGEKKLYRITSLDNGSKYDIPILYWTSFSKTGTTGSSLASLYGTEYIQKRGINNDGNRIYPLKQKKIGWKLPYDATFRFQYQNFYNVLRYTRLGTAKMAEDGVPYVVNGDVVQAGFSVYTDGTQVKAGSNLPDTELAFVPSKSDDRYGYWLTLVEDERLRPANESATSWTPKLDLGNAVSSPTLWYVRKIRITNDLEKTGDTVEWDKNIEDFDWGNSFFKDSIRKSVLDTTKYPPLYEFGGSTEYLKAYEKWNNGIQSPLDRPDPRTYPLVVSFSIYLRSGRLPGVYSQKVVWEDEIYDEETGLTTYPSHRETDLLIRCRSKMSGDYMYYLVPYQVESVIRKHSWEYHRYYVKHAVSWQGTDDTVRYEHFEENNILNYGGSWGDEPVRYEDIDFDSAEVLGESPEFAKETSSVSGVEWIPAPTLAYVNCSVWNFSGEGMSPYLHAEKGDPWYRLLRPGLSLMEEEQATFKNGVVKLLPKFHDELYLAVTDDPVALDTPGACNPVTPAPDVQIIPIAKNGLQLTDRISVRRGKCFNFFYAGNCHMDFQFQAFIDPFVSNPVYSLELHREDEAGILDLPILPHSISFNENGGPWRFEADSETYWDRETGQKMTRPLYYVVDIETIQNIVKEKIKDRRGARLDTKKYVPIGYADDTDVFLSAGFSNVVDLPGGIPSEGFVINSNNGGGYALVQMPVFGLEKTTKTMSITLASDFEIPRSVEVDYPIDKVYVKEWKTFEYAYYASGWHSSPPFQYTGWEYVNNPADGVISCEVPEFNGYNFDSSPIL